MIKKKPTQKKSVKKKIKKTKVKTKSNVPKDLQAAFDRFPAILKAKEKASKERKRIMKNFMAAKDDLFRK